MSNDNRPEEIDPEVQDDSWWFEGERQLVLASLTLYPDPREAAELRAEVLASERVDCSRGPWASYVHDLSWGPWREGATIDDTLAGRAGRVDATAPGAVGAEACMRAIWAQYPPASWRLAGRALVGASLALMDFDDERLAECWRRLKTQTEVNPADGPWASAVECLLAMQDRRQAEGF